MKYNMGNLRDRVDMNKWHDLCFYNTESYFLKLIKLLVRKSSFLHQKILREFESYWWLILYYCHRYAMQHKKPHKEDRHSNPGLTTTKRNKKGRHVRLRHVVLIIDMETPLRMRLVKEAVDITCPVEPLSEASIEINSFWVPLRKYESK